MLYDINKHVFLSMRAYLTKSLRHKVAYNAPVIQSHSRSIPATPAHPWQAPQTTWWLLCMKIPNCCMPFENSTEGDPGVVEKPLSEGAMIRTGHPSKHCCGTTLTHLRSTIQRQQISHSGETSYTLILKRTHLEDVPLSTALIPKTNNLNFWIPHTANHSRQCG